MPTATDLVTDLPADFAVFGQGVDTTMADLKGGTTGQILSKATNTDMDFTWVAPTTGDITGVTAGTGISGGGTSGDVTITNSMATAMTTSGDLIQATGSGTFARLGTGTAGQYLTTNGTTNSWGSINAGGMTLLSTTTLSGASTTISSISQSYVDLVIFIYGVTNATADGVFRIEPNAGTGDVSNFHRASSSTWTASNLIRLLLSANTGGDIVGRTNASNAWTVTISNYAATARKPMLVNGGYLNANADYIGYLNTAYSTSSAAISSIVLNNSGGAFSSGTVLIYGVK